MTEEHLLHQASIFVIIIIINIIVIISVAIIYAVKPPPIIAKKWDPGILDPSCFSVQIRKVEARLGKLAKIRKVETN